MSPISSVISNHLYNERARTDFLDVTTNTWLRDPVDRLTGVLKPAGIIMGVEDDYTNSTSFTVSVMSVGVGALKIPAEVTLHYNKIYGGDVCRKSLYAVIGPSPELFGAGETGRHGSFAQLFSNDISSVMQLRADLAVTTLDEAPQLSDVVCVDDQQYAIWFYVGDKAETEHGVYR
jgi:hypothetical protein